MDPTSSRWRVFWALHKAIDANGHSPTIREVAKLVGLTIGTVHPHLRALRRDRWIDWPAGKARSITILHVPNPQPTRPSIDFARSPGRSGNGGPRRVRVHVDLSEFAIAAGPPTGCSRSRRPSPRPASNSKTGTTSPTAWKATLCATLPSSTATACWSDDRPMHAMATSWLRRYPTRSPGAAGDRQATLSS
jgi:LexA DNA binding domain